MGKKVINGSGPKGANHLLYSYPFSTSDTEKRSKFLTPDPCDVTGYATIPQDHRTSINRELINLKATVSASLTQRVGGVNTNRI